MSDARLTLARFELPFEPAEPPSGPSVSRTRRSATTSGGAAAQPDAAGLASFAWQGGPSAGTAGWSSATRSTHAPDRGLPAVQRLSWRESPTSPTPSATWHPTNAAASSGRGSTSTAGDAAVATVARFPTQAPSFGARAAGRSGLAVGGHRTPATQPAATGPAGSPADVAVAMGLGAVAADGSVLFDTPADVSNDAASASPDAVSNAEVMAQPEAIAASALPALSTAGEAAPPDGAAVAGTAAPSAAAGLAGPDLDALALRLYPRISRQLRLELTRERDRIGSLTDLRY